ncbi:MAG: radical SAM protein [Methanomicrobiales archaeon]|nr:radical SAM protein [Methanomicrobiales archaeon]
MDTNESSAGYLALHESGELRERAETACEILKDCIVCPQECHVNRLQGEVGFCSSGSRPLISSYGPHFGEEPPLVGRNGSGTIFLTNCNMRCMFCQNYEISQCGKGTEISCEALAEIMLRLQQRGCHNINFVSPSHFVPPLIRAVDIAAGEGLHIPLVYNSGGYDSVSTLRLLESVFDIYMPDAKYGRNEVAWELSHAKHYVEQMHAALKEMHRQVGDLKTIGKIAIRGMIIRHLVLPHNLASSELVLRFIAEEISKDSYVNIMDQYRWPGGILDEASNPSHLFSLLQRPITADEYAYAVQCAREEGLHRGF